MNIKSLLLGSAAALVAVSGARAADAVVIAEPEPMEYVRVCDVYGTGFFYIPGTETCLRISGYVRYDIRVGDAIGNQDVIDKKDFAEGELEENDTYEKRARFDLRVDARSETELGTLRGYGEIRYNFNTAVNGGFTDNESAIDVNHVYIELGGFRIGKTDSLFTTWTGYAGAVILDDIAVGYGPFDTHQIAYTWTGANGFSAAIALEMGDGDDEAFGIDTDGDGVVDAVSSISDIYTVDSYVPHVTGGVAYTAAWGGVSAVVGYDSVWEEWAAKARLDVNATEQLALFVMAGYASKDDDFVDAGGFGFVNGGPNYYGSWGGDWAVWGGATYTVSEKTKINAQLAYDEAENFSAGLNVAYELVPGLVITPEIVYVDNFDDDLGDDNDAFGGMVRFQRTF
ncbi:porin [Mesorhizobium sp. AaZ16]|uniref:porin n=1 Tax=Mesorhizobium sp. AaZ16 TaxID=3402289 RepID=UPI00374FB0EC